VRMASFIPVGIPKRLAAPEHVDAIQSGWWDSNPRPPDP
jgi:hypothetical protein